LERSIRQKSASEEKSMDMRVKCHEVSSCVQRFNRSGSTGSALFKHELFPRLPCGKVDVPEKLSIMFEKWTNSFG
jgi:hypothetical protein